jgi:hypothetical protein
MKPVSAGAEQQAVVPALSIARAVVKVFRRLTEAGRAGDDQSSARPRQAIVHLTLT